MSDEEAWNEWFNAEHYRTAEMGAGWMAACEYKNKRIAELEGAIYKAINWHTNQRSPIIQRAGIVQMLKSTLSGGGADVCKWIEDSNGWTHTSCGVTPFKINPYPTEEQMCGHCRKPILITEGGADECQACKGSGRRWLTEKHTITNEDCPSCNGTGHISEGDADE